jgi:mono/diheme cytochrome c family protein
VDRQAVFKGDCASCHVKKPGRGQIRPALFDAVLRRLPRGENRATMVPDLHNLKVPTNEEFWRTWITAGKAGSLMPAFATSQGGPLNDMQIASLAAISIIAVARIRRRPGAAAGQVKSACGIFPARYPVNHDSKTG